MLTITWILYYAFVYGLSEFYRSVIQPQLDQFIFTPGALFKIGTTLFLIIYLFIRCFYFTNKKSSKTLLIVQIIQTVLSILILVFLTRYRPRLIYWYLFMISEEVCLTGFLLWKKRKS